MPIPKPKMTYNAHGTPAVWAENPAQAYYGLGWLHARHRPVQALVLATAARGELAGRLVARQALQHLDALVHRLDLPARGKAEAQTLDVETAAWLDAYLQGFAAGRAAHGLPWEMRALLARLPPLGRAEVLGGLMLSAYLGLAEGQEHMERALIDCLHADADASLLEEMFAPHLSGWDPALLREIDPQVAPGFATHALRVAGGSNAWAVTGARTASGKPLLCGDPHLQINQLPCLFLEVRVQLGRDVWLGATIPGLPGIAVGRNKQLAWSGTFACADNVDMTVERLAGGRLMRAQGPQAPKVRRVKMGRRGLPPRQQIFWESEHGVLQSTEDGTTVAVQWAALQGAGEALGAYMHLPLAQSAQAAATVLRGAHTLSLHFVLADRGGAVLYKQAGRIPRRQGGWSGLHPVPAEDERRWNGFYTGAALPESHDEDMVVSANEARLAADGGVLATLGQPPYRQTRIRQVLESRRDHTVASMQALQQDLLSLQGLTLRPWLLAALPAGPVKSALQSWDGQCGIHSVGAHAFHVAYRAATAGLAPRLGGAWWRRMLARSEISVWWCRGIDRMLQSAATWEGEGGHAMHAALTACADTPLQPWGQVQQVTLNHMIFGELPDALQLNRGPYPLPGSIATVSQGNLVPSAAGAVAVGPAYRMVCDLADDDAVTSLPGGVDGSRFAASYTCWLDDFRAGRYHRLAAPTGDEGDMPP